MIEGSTEYEFSDQKTVDLPGGHFLIVPARTRHRGVRDIRRPGRLCSIQLDFDTKSAASLTPFSTVEFRWLRQQYTSAQLLAYSMNSELRRLTNGFSNRIRSFDKSQVDLAASLRLMACEILVETAKQLTQAKAILPSEAVRAAVQFMNDRYAEPLSIVDIANKIGISRSRLFAAFKTAMGMTPNDFLQRLRVSKAAALLKNSDRSITDIAMQCGFSTSQYFSFVFSKYHDAPPKSYRDHQRKIEG